MEAEATILAALIGLIPSIVAFMQYSAKRKALNEKEVALNEKEEAENKLDDIFKPASVGVDFRASVMLLGIGGTGKTTFIRRLINDARADPDKKTQYYEIYRGMRTFRNKEDNENKCHIWISDYMGQNLGTLTRAFIEQQKIPQSPMAYGYINSLILMVDVREPKHNPSDPEPEASNKPDLERVKTHNSQWSEQALDAISGLVTEELKYVCLFINKVDLLADNSPEARQSYINLFKPLHNILLQKFGKDRVAMHLGSAQENALGDVPESIINSAESDQ